MAEAANMDNVQNIREPNPAYTVREPTIMDAVSLAGILAEGAENPQIFDAIESENNEAAMLFLFTGALRNPVSRNGLMYLLADLWIHEVDKETVEEPHDEWDYEPLNDKAPTREQQWKSISRKNRKRMIKRFEVGELPFSALMDFGRALAALESINDFLSSVNTLVGANSGKSSTSSKEDTEDGRTNESTKSTARGSAESSNS